MNSHSDPLPEDNSKDVFVWVWSSFETCWYYVTNYTAETFFKVYPDRYIGWLPADAIPLPKKGLHPRFADNQQAEN